MTTVRSNHVIENEALRLAAMCSFYPRSLVIPAEKEPGERDHRPSLHDLCVR